MRSYLLAAILVCLGAQSGCARAGDAERALWLEDFEQLVDHMSAVYANLEWAVRERGIDVAGLSARARADLGKARNRRGARKVIERFVEAFDDPHFFVRDLQRVAASGEAPPALARDADAGEALDFMGFKGRNLDFRIDVEKLGEFERLSEKPFVSGRWTLSNGVHVGLLRIAHFGEDGYPEVARPLWPGYAAELADDCDIYCQWDFRYRVMNALLAELSRTVRELRDRGIDALVVDISRNGGGTDWAAIAPRILAPPLLRCPQIGLVRHPHHADRLESRLAATEELLAKLELTPRSRRMLERARDSLRESWQTSTEPCDRRAFFDDPADAPECSQLVLQGACGSIDYLSQGLLDDVEDRSSVFSPFGFEYEEGVWAGPLFVVMDGGTASASEQFLALLEANEAATFLGATSYGAGCGFIGGGVPAHLKNVEVTVRMPDCARFRADGRNEVDGIDPDLALDFEHGDRKRAEELFRVLEQRLAGVRDFDEEAAREQILARGRQFSEAFVAGDTTTLGELYLPGAQIVPPGRVLRGRATVRRYFAPVAGRTQLAHRMEQESLRFDGDVAIDRGRWISNTQRDGEAPQEASGPYWMIWRRDAAGDWAIWLDLWTSE